MSDPKAKRAISDSGTKDCYCGLWTTNPAYLREQGIPEGFCGICQRCNRPGHTRHFPGPVPYTGSWCDTCYRNLASSWPLRSPAAWFMLLVFGLSAFSIYHFISKMVE
jgi:hypothetical protein